MRGLSNQIFYLLALSIAENICGKTVTENAFSLDPAFPLAHWACPVPTCHKYWNNGLKASGFRVWQHVLGIILKKWCLRWKSTLKIPTWSFSIQIFSSQWKAKAKKTKQHKTRTTYFMSLRLLHYRHQFSISLMSGSKSTVQLAIGKRGLC